MRIVAVSVALFLTICGFFAYASAQECTPQFTTPLKMGDRGVEVHRLQNFLIFEGMDIPAGATGYFGTQTKAAVNEFQLKYSFQILYPLKLTKPTGAVYSATLAQMNAIACI